MTTKARAPIVNNGGFLKLDNLFSADWLAALKNECQQHRSQADVQQKKEKDFSAWRGSNPDRFLESADGGEIQTELYQSTYLNQMIAEYCGRSVQPTGSHGTFSYYDQPGHYLGLHRDIDGCDVTLISCLKIQKEQSGSGALRVYRNSLKRQLAELDNAAANENEAEDIHLAEGQSILLLGGWVPHEVLPAVSGFERQISALCFRMI